MPNLNHPWIQDYASFEAVLSCKNEIEQWDKAATIRAFQTYGFDDASTNDAEELSFAHIGTGVMLMSDGDVVAIQFGDGKLPSALSDLFLVLSALGWTEAEVFHPPETLGPLLNDMGRAIPGHMNFDVRAAQAVTDPAGFTETAAFTDSAKNLLQGVGTSAAEFNELAFRELTSMSPEAGKTGPSEPNTAVFLDDALEDEDFQQVSTEPVRTARQFEVATQPSGRPFIFDDDAAPVVPVLIGRQIDDTPIHPTIESETYKYRETPAAPIEQNPLDDNDVPQDDIQVASDFVKQSMVPEAFRKNVESQIQQEDPSKHEECIAVRTTSVRHNVKPSGKVTGIRIAESALVFNFPEDTVTVEEINCFATDNGFIEVVNVWPGLANQTHRWDLIREIDLEAPGFAEVIANEVVPDQHREARPGMALALVTMARQRNDLQVRDLIAKVSEGRCSDFLPLSGTDATVKVLMDCFSGLKLSEEGEAFLDVRPSVNDGVDRNVVIQPFTVRAMLEDGEKRLYVFHVDSTDGPFVEKIVGLLRAVAVRWSSSTRARARAESVKLDAERHIEKQREIERAVAIKTMNETMVGLMTIMKKAGLEVPQL